MSLSLAAVVGGFARFRPGSGIRGAVLNRCPPALYPRLKECVERETGVRVLGYLPDLPQAHLESRHLGLVTAAEVSNLREKLLAVAEQCEKTVDLDGILEIARSAPRFRPRRFMHPPGCRGAADCRRKGRGVLLFL